jgi:hypothetical protein
VTRKLDYIAAYTYFFHTKPRVDLMMTRFFFRRKKLAFSSKTNVMVNLFAKTSRSLSKKRHFFAIFWRKYFINHTKHRFLALTYLTAPASEAKKDLLLIFFNYLLGKLQGRVARFFLTQYTQNEEKYTKLPLNYQMAIKNNKWP